MAQGTVDDLINEEARRRGMAKQPNKTNANQLAAENKIETARLAGKPLTGTDFYSSESKAALSRLLAKPSGFKNGGKVKKSGMAMVHKGETVRKASKRSR